MSLFIFICTVNPNQTQLHSSSPLYLPYCIHAALDELWCQVLFGPVLACPSLEWDAQGRDRHGMRCCETGCAAGVKPLNKRDKQLLRMVFESWREHTVESHASRFRKKLALEQRGMSLLLLESAWLIQDRARYNLSLVNELCAEISSAVCAACDITSS